MIRDIATWGLGLLRGRWRELRFRYLGRRSWLERKDAKDGHVAAYWGNMYHPNRDLLIDVLVELVEARPVTRSVRMLEFGCHAGMNFNRLADRLGDRAVEYFGVEPNHDACEHLRQQLPFVSLLEAEDDAFVGGAFPPGGRIDIGFVNVVFYSVAGKRTRATLRKLCAISDVLVLGERFTNTGTTTRFEQDPEMYVHPYEAWLSEAGFVRERVVPAPIWSPQFSGFLIARRR